MERLYELPRDEMMAETRRVRERAARERRLRRRRGATALCAVLIAAAAVTALGASLAQAAHPAPEVPAGDDVPSGGEGGSGYKAETGSETGSETGVTPPEIPDWIDEDLLPVNEYSRPGTPLTQVNGVVVHYVGNPDTTAWQNKNYFANLAETHDTYASSNLIVGLDGEIILCVPLNEIAYCSTVRNKDTISIEVCHPDETGKFSETTMNSLIRLLRWLCASYDLDREDILRHYDADGKVCPTWYVNNSSDWEALRDRVFEAPEDY